ncbi:hypothetical protein ACFQFH_15005 [Halobaculum halobium]|uniref:NrS-1 polymerase-like HBD domain-containing protein n=1 Tax=Halobaculum halobium TaxID=3032281 RepID=A0ABD5TDH1_9EURY|nr:hypothetical protein [Halobaculum sp. SYNS20]
MSRTFASTADPETWSTFEEALSTATRPDVSGIGFVFTSDDPYVGVDLDDCRDPESGAFDPDAIRIVTRLQSYTEVSPSGTGVHVIARGRLPGGPRRRGGVEMYDDARFFTMTGDRVQGTPERACVRPSALRWVHASYVADDDDEGPDEAVSSRVAQVGSVSTTMDDTEVLQRAKAAKNGEKFSRLWNGSISGYESHSEADMALCCLLAFWTGGDDVQMDRLFRESGLLREKWDEVHFSDGATYGERTIERAIVRTDDLYR